MRFSNFPNLLYINSTITDGNMSFNTGDYFEALTNREKIANKNGFFLSYIASVNQVHGSEVIVVSKRNLEIELNADGMVTNQIDIYLLIKIADCLSIALFDPKHNAIGITHGGWQGLDKGILKKIIRLMKQKFKTNPKDLLVEFSPAVGPCHYGGPPELRKTKKPKWKAYIAKDADKNHGVDLWQCAENQLIKLGVFKINIYNHKVCTFENKNYFSHRRSVLTKEPDYRFATILGMKS